MRTAWRLLTTPYWTAWNRTHQGPLGPLVDMDARSADSEVPSRVHKNKSPMPLRRFCYACELHSVEVRSLLPSCCLVNCELQETSARTCLSWYMFTR